VHLGILRELCRLPLGSHPTFNGPHKQMSFHDWRVMSGDVVNQALQAEVLKRASDAASQPVTALVTSDLAGIRIAVRTMGCRRDKRGRNILRDSRRLIYS